MNKYTDIFNFAIIGGGAAGLYLANKLKENEKVALIESGSKNKYTENKNHNYFMSKNSLHKISINHFTGIGGNTNKWGGQLLPFSENDINKSNGWPIEFEELSENYTKITKELLGQEFNFNSIKNIVSFKKLKIFDLSNSNFKMHVSAALREKNFKKLFLKKIKKKLKIIDNCYVNYLEYDNDGFYKIYCENKDSIKIIRSKKIIITCGAIQSVRLLMNSAICGNLKNNINFGKGFMDHLATSKLKLKLKNRFKFLSFFNTKYLPNGNKISLRLSASDDYIKKYNYNISATIKVNSPKSLIGKFINLISITLTKDIFNFIYKPFGEVVLCFFVEQKISKEKNITLNPAGNPILSWLKDDKEVKQIQVFQKIIIESLIKNNFIEDSEEVLNNEKIINELSGNNHPMGGAIMHKEKRKSVVDSNLQVIGNKDLYLCSTAIFPSGSFSNPTMTLLAFANRLADRLNKK